MNFSKKKKVNNIEEVDESYNSYLSAPDGEIIEKSSGRDAVKSLLSTTGGGIKFIIGAILLIVTVVMATYTVLGGTLMYLAPTDDATEKTWVARGTFSGGKIPHDTTVYASTTTTVAENFMGKAIEAYTGVPEAITAKVIAGPVVEVDTNKKGFITINGKASEHKGNIKKAQLKNEYLMQCLSGSCTKGEYLVVPYDVVSGEVKAYVGLSGVKTVD